jgi:transposase
VIQLVPHLKVLIAYEPVDFRKGIDSLAGLCRDQFAEDPFSGAVFVFRNRAGTALKLLVYDGQGFWLCQKRFSQSKLQWWPRRSEGLLQGLPAEQLSVLQSTPTAGRGTDPARFQLRMRARRVCGPGIVARVQTTVP